MPVFDIHRTKYNLLGIVNPNSKNQTADKQIKIQALGTATESEFEEENIRIFAIFFLTRHYTARCSQKSTSKGQSRFLL